MFDYRDPECAKHVKGYTNDTLKLVWDCISTDESAKFCTEVISSQGGRYGKINFTELDRPDVKQTFTLGYTALGEELGPPFPPFTKERLNADMEFIVGFVRMAEK